MRYNIPLKIIVVKIYYRIKYLILFPTRKKYAKKILSAEETIDYIIENKCSVCRYGDGEFGLIWSLLTGKPFSIGFQEYDSCLAKRLYEILTKKSSNYMIGLPKAMFLPNAPFAQNIGKLIKFSKNIWVFHSVHHIPYIKKYLNPTCLYLNASFTRYYIDFKEQKGCSKYIKRLKKIWENRNLLIVEGSQTKLGIGNDLLSNSLSIRRIICPSIGAFSKIGEIENTIAFYAKEDDLILIALGPTATVIAAEMAEKGFQSIDIGHIDIEYEWYLQNAKSRIRIPNKYVNEAGGYLEESEINDCDYLNQVITTI